MKTISLGNSIELILVSDEDYDYLIQWNWSKIFNGRDGRICRCEIINGKRSTIYLHEVIAERMELNLDYIIDHKDRNQNNNQRNNLRNVTSSQSNINRGLGKNNKTGYKGVYFDEEHQKYRASVRINRILKHLGYYDTPEKAAYEYDFWVKFYFGEFAVLNFPNGESDYFAKTRK